MEAAKEQAWNDLSRNMQIEKANPDVFVVTESTTLLEQQLLTSDSESDMVDDIVSQRAMFFSPTIHLREELVPTGHEVIFMMVQYP